MGIRSTLNKIEWDMVVIWIIIGVILIGYICFMIVSTLDIENMKKWCKSKEGIFEGNDPFRDHYCLLKENDDYFTKYRIDTENGSYILIK